MYFESKKNEHWFCCSDKIIFRANKRFSGILSSEEKNHISQNLEKSFKIRQKSRCNSC